MTVSTKFQSIVFGLVRGWDTDTQIYLNKFGETNVDLKISTHKYLSITCYFLISFSVEIKSHHTGNKFLDRLNIAVTGPKNISNLEKEYVSIF